MYLKRILIISCFMFLITSAGKSQTIDQQLQILQTQEPQSLQQQYADQLIGFAKKLIGVPYRFASSDPQKGFDCSGFVNYVFENFGIKVPRSSREFTDTGTPVTLENAKVGDVLLFTGTNVRVRKIGHVGIIYAIDGDEIQFIHATSGKAHAVTITTMDAYYKSRFMKAVSIFKKPGTI